MRKMAKLMVVLVIVSLGFGMVGCAKEDTLAIERNLYHDIQQTRRMALNFVSDFADDLVDDFFQMDYELHERNLINYRKSIEGIEFPAHLEREEEQFWRVAEQASKNMEDMIVKYRDDMEIVSYEDEVVDYFDHGYKRVYDGFREFGIE